MAAKKKRNKLKLKSYAYRDSHYLSGKVYRADSTEIVHFKVAQLYPGARQYRGSIGQWCWYAGDKLVAYAWPDQHSVEWFYRYKSLA